MFRVSSTHLQEDIVVYKQHMVSSLSIRVLVACWYAAVAAYQQATRNSYREWRYHMLLVYNYVLLKMSTWYSKHVAESNNILRINNSQCIKLVIIVWSIHDARSEKHWVCPLSRLHDVSVVFQLLVTSSSVTEQSYIDLCSTEFRYLCVEWIYSENNGCLWWWWWW